MPKITIEGKINQFFSPKNVADVISSAPKPQTPIKDLLFPPAKQKQKASAFLRMEEIEDIVGAIPLIRRGSGSLPVGHGGRSIQVIEPAPFRPSDFLSAKDANDYIATGNATSVQALLSERIVSLRDKISISTEILSAQALSGTISYPVAMAGGGQENYVAEIGSPKSIGNTNIAADDMGKLQKKLEEQYAAQRRLSATGKIRFLCGSEAYAKAVSIIADAKNVPVQWTDWGMVFFGKYELMPISMAYALPGSSNPVDVLDAKSIQTIDTGANDKLFYLALDEFDAKLAPLPFFVKQIPSQDPSGYTIIAESKPFPAFAANRTTLRKVLS